MPELLTDRHEIVLKSDLWKLVAPLLLKLWRVHLRIEMGIWPKRFVSFLYRHFTLLNGFAQFRKAGICFMDEMFIGRSVVVIGRVVGIRGYEFTHALVWCVRL